MRGKQLETPERGRGGIQRFERRGAWGTGSVSVEEVRAVQRIPLHRFKPGIANDMAQLFFRGAVGHARSSHHVFLEHYGTNVIAAEAEAHLADFQSLRHPA